MLILHGSKRTWSSIRNVFWSLQLFKGFKSFVKIKKEESVQTQANPLANLFLYTISVRKLGWDNWKSNKSD